MQNLPQQIKNFYLNNLLPESELMKLPMSIIVEELINQYNLHNIAEGGWLYIGILKGMYDLKQSGRIAHDELVKHLLLYGYKPSKRTPGLWKHDTKPISFILCVDDFGIKYIGKHNLQHLQQALKDKYDSTQDDTRSLYCRLNLKRDYIKRKVELSMPNYVKEALHKYIHENNMHLTL